MSDRLSSEAERLNGTHILIVVCLLYRETMLFYLYARPPVVYGG